MKNKQYLIIAVGVLIAFTVAGTYAFFQVLGGSTETRNVTVQTSTTDSLTFNVTKDIEIEASRENFYQNAGNLSDTTTATARLVPNSKTNSATANYNVYVVIDSNNFVYTTEAHTPELLLTITDPDGNRHGNIVGLNGDNGVFDITTRTGAFLVAEDYEISASTAQGTTQTWTMTVTLVNLDTDQNNNTGKTLTGTIYITKEDLTTYSLAELNAIRTSRTNEQTGEEVSNIHSTSITVDVETTSGTEGIGTYYFGIEEQSSTGYINVANQTINGIEYFESNEPTYTFTNLKGNTDYTVYAFVEDGAGFKSNIYNTTVTTEEYILPSVTNVTTEVLSLSSLKATATASAGENQVSKYYFNCGDGNGWSEAQDSNEYTCSGLSYNTNYNVQVKVIDTYGEYSVEYVKPSEIRAYEVTYSCTNCTSSKNSEYILANSSSSATITANTHYNLTSATTTGCTLSNGVATVSGISSNTTCNVTASGNNYTISLDNQTATTTGSTSVVETYGTGYSVTSISLPAKTGYTFGGYYTNTNGGGTQIINANGVIVGDNKQFTDATTIYAKWTANNYTITFVGHEVIETGLEEGTVSLNSTTASVPVVAGRVMNLATNTYYIVSFDYQSTTGTNQFDVDLIPDTLPQILPTATTTKQHYDWELTSTNTDMQSSYLRFFDDVAPSTDGGYTNITNVLFSKRKQESVTYNAALPTITAPTRRGYTFGGYYTGTNGTGTQYYNASGTKVVNSYTTADNIKLYAKWTPNSYSCAAGTYLAYNELSCSACPAGSYCTAGTRKFKSVAVGSIQSATFTENDNGRGNTLCSSLGAGYTSNAGANATTSCYLNVSAGYYKNSANGTGVTACANGSYRAAHTSNYGSADTCTACAGGYTNSGSANSTCSLTCSNNANVASWKTPTWSANAVGNLCAANTCNSGYEVSGANCVVSYKCSEGELTANASLGSSTGGYICLAQNTQYTYHPDQDCHSGACNDPYWEDGHLVNNWYSCEICDDTSYYSYDCVNGWTYYSGSGATTYCYKLPTK